jgi:hypothetical protein
MGDQERRFYTKGALISLPNPKTLLKKLRETRVRENLVAQLGERRFRFLLPLLVKAEINPLFAFGEIILTWIFVLSCT